MGHRWRIVKTNVCHCHRCGLTRTRYLLTGPAGATYDIVWERAGKAIPSAVVPPCAALVLPPEDLD